MSNPNLFLVFDVESIGLHGEGYAVGYTVVTRQGVTLESDWFSCDPGDADGYPEDRAWVKANIPPIWITSDTPREVRDRFWSVWMRWKAEGAVLVADCGWPVEARFLAACVDDGAQKRNWEGPYPLYDLSSIMLAQGKDPLATRERMPDELPVHDPMADAKQSARLLIECLNQKLPN